ncbi:hypothetical protein [Mumia sp. DW29H23]|uniref:hypothetical protein n=1 Tax=Mumia sp. DW29H23 TaxID=3421241 RepID=UPI003D69F775
MIIRGSATAAVMGGDYDRQLPIGKRGATRYADHSVRATPCTGCKRNTKPADKDQAGRCGTCAERARRAVPSVEEVPPAPAIVPAPRPKRTRTPKAKARPAPPRERRAPRLRPIDADAVVAAYAERSIDNIAADIQVSARRVRETLIAAGVPIRPSGTRIKPGTTRRSRTFDAGAAVAAYRDGNGIGAIAKKLRVGKARVRDAVLQAGLEIRPEGGIPGRPRTRKDAA